MTRSTQPATKREPVNTDTMIGAFWNSKRNITRLREFLEIHGWKRTQLGKCGPRYFLKLKRRPELALERRPPNLQILPFREVPLSGINSPKAHDAFKAEDDHVWSRIERLPHETVVTLDWEGDAELTGERIGQIHTRSIAAGAENYNRQPVTMAKHWRYGRLSRMLTARSDIRIFPGANWTKEAHEKVRAATNAEDLHGLERALARLRSLTLFLSALESARECQSQTVAMVQAPELIGDLEHLAITAGVAFHREPPKDDIFQTDQA